MKHNQSMMLRENSSPDFFSSQLQSLPQSNPKLVRRLSVSTTSQKANQYLTNPRRQNLSAMNNDFLMPRTSASFSVPLLVETMNTFFQKTKTMEEEIMLPSRLRDMPVDELVFDNSVQPDNWHEIYTFIREMRNQLQCIYPFAEDNEKDHSKEKQRKYSTDDEGIIVSNQDNTQFSSASSTASSDEFEQSSASSAATSCDTIKDELKYHYYGLFRSLNNLTSLANRVTEKYREECVN